MTTSKALPSVDVIIPVYNAPVLTKRCIDSVITCLKKSIRFVYVQDDASDAPTRDMLDSLSYQQVKVHHATKNQGFGITVNEAISRSDACYVLVLNSDTMVNEDFIPLLCAAFTADPKLAVISPAHKGFARYDLNRYRRNLGGYIPTNRFKGHAFLIQRRIFQEIGGFDLAFGRGYFEDIDLGRRLNQQGWHMGVHPDANIQHVGGGSFGRGRSYRRLMQHNRTLYLTRYPGVYQNILLITKSYNTSDLPFELINAVNRVFRQGGNLHWLTPVPVPKLVCLHIRNSPTSLIIIRLIFRGWWRKDKRISVIWLLPGTPRLQHKLIVLLARIRKLDVLVWDMPQQDASSQIFIE